MTPLARRAMAARELISRGEVDPWVGLFFVVAPPQALEECHIDRCGRRPLRPHGVETDLPREDGDAARNIPRM